MTDLGLMVAVGQVCLGPQGYILTQAVAVEGDFEAVVVPVAADKGQDVVGGAVAAEVEQEGVGVESDDDGVGRPGGWVGAYGADECGGSGIGAPVDGVDGYAVVLAEHGDGARVVAHGVVADGHAEVGAVLGGADIAGLCQVVVGDAPAYHIGGHQAAVGGGVHAFQQVNHRYGPLAEAG